MKIMTFFIGARFALGLAGRARRTLFQNLPNGGSSLYGTSNAAEVESLSIDEKMK
jgi:hypothetical protein